MYLNYLCQINDNFEMFESWKSIMHPQTQIMTDIFFSFWMSEHMCIFWTDEITE